MASATESEKIEGPFLKVPFESLRRVAKARKVVIDELNGVIETVDKAAEDATLTLQEASLTLGRLESNLQTLKRKIVESTPGEIQDAQRCRARLQHLADIGPPQKDHILEWNRHRLNRILVDHMLRCGYHQSAQQLVAEAGLQVAPSDPPCQLQDPATKDLVDLEVYMEAKRVVDDLQQHSCAAAIQWCDANKARLQRIKSQLLFRLRIQEFIELVRADDMMGAIQYARRHLAEWAPHYLPEFTRAFATVAFRASTRCRRYSELFREDCWAELVDLFRQDVYRLSNLTLQSLLSIHLQAGLSALKTPQSCSSACSKDPLHLPTFQKLADRLPYAKHDSSKLICCITKEIMDERNPPMVLPNCHVYSHAAVQQIMAENDGQVVCPLTGERFDEADVQRAFIVG